MAGADRHRMWFVVADEGRALLLEQAEPGAALEKVAELEDELAHARGQDLRNDAKGRFYGKGERFMAHTTEPHTDPKRKEAQKFARQVADYLEQAQNQRRFDRLFLVAAPTFLGLLRAELAPNVRKAVAGELDHDLAHLNLPELTQRLAALPVPA